MRSIGLVWLCLAIGMGGSGSALAQAPVDRGWGFGWDDGLTLRRWLGGVWEIGLAAGPDDYLIKDEVRTYDPTWPQDLNGRLEVPRDLRDEHGWVRLQLGRLVAHRDDLTLVGFVGGTYEWIDHQERRLALDELMGDYDTFELDRFTSHWVLDFGLRPAWRATEFLTIETAFTLRFSWENWDQVVGESWAGFDDEVVTSTSGHGRSFSDAGWEGTSSLQFLFWF